MKRPLRRGLYAPELLEARIAPATIIVTSLADNGGGADKTLREAIDEANLTTVADTITFAPALFPAGVPGVITLNGTEIPITGTTTIKGPGIDKLTISGNDASRIFRIEDGDADVLHPTTISGITFVDGRTTGIGGAISSTEPLTVTNAVFHSNYADDRGGAVNVDTTGKVIFTNVRLTDNESGNSIGGAVFADAGGGILISKCLLSGNVAKNGGGALYLRSGEKKGAITIDGSTFVGNDTGGSGGALTINQEAGGKVTLKNSTFTGNIATGNGGALYLEDGFLAVDKCVFTLNSAGSSGGAIGDDRGDGTKISNSRFDRNSAVNYGGALYLQGDHAVTVTGSFFTGNQSKGDGGAIYVDQDSELTVKGSTFAGNSALDQGGAIAIFGAGAKLILATSVLSGNTATEGGGVFGGEGTTVTVTGGIFSGNVATEEGGAIHTSGAGVNGVDLSVTGALFQGNQSANYGGAVFASGDGKVLMKGVKVIGNQSTGSRGGGMYLSSAESVTVTGSLFQHNSASGQGGGLVVVLQTTTTVGNISGSKFLDNFSGSEGGGIIYFATGASVLTIKSSLISGNIALIQGGGISNSSNLAVLTGSVIIGNWAPANPNIAP